MCHCAGFIREINPGGKLAESFPLNTEDIPSYRFSSARIGSRNVPYKESIYVGYRYYQSAHKDVLFPFGFGLSYTTFTYRNLRVSSSNLLSGIPCVWRLILKIQER
jgi:beta-glucosidase